MTHFPFPFRGTWLCRSWSKASITIAGRRGHRVRISTTPHSGLNRRLIAVGATYGVIHYLSAAADPVHWSVSGH